MGRNMTNKSWIRNNIDVIKVRQYIDKLMSEGNSISKIGNTINVTYRIMHGVARHNLIPSRYVVDHLCEAYGLPESTFQLFPESLLVGILIEYAKQRGDRLPYKSKLPLAIADLCKHYKYTNLVKKVSDFYGFNVYKTEKYKRTDAELLGEIKRYHIEYGAVPRCDDMLLSRTILARFGTWNKAIELAKLKPNKIFKPRKKREETCAR